MHKQIHAHIHRCSLSLACCLLCLCLGCHAVKPKLQAEDIRPGLSQDWHDLLDEYRESVSKGMKENKIPGLSIALVDREGIIWTAGFGYTDCDCRTPVTPDTIFSIQSMTKNMTGTLVMFAIQDGLVDLDTPITEYIADFTVKSKFEENPQDKITLRHLLTHRSGLIHEAPIGNKFEPDFPSWKAHIESISDTWLKCRVGGKEWAYSNVGIDLAAYILEVRSGKPYAGYLKEKLLDPLDMPNSSADMRIIRNQTNRAIGHSPYHQMHMHLEIPVIGAGGVYTSAKDYSKFIQFFLNRGSVNDQTLLQESVFRAMHVGARVQDRFVAGNAIYFANEGSARLDEDGNGLSGSGGGGGSGFLTHASWSYEYGIGGLIFTNNRYDYSWWPEDLTYEIIRELIHRRLIGKEQDSYCSSPWTEISYSKDTDDKHDGADPNTFTRYKPQWKEYTGTYEHLYGWKPTLLGRIGDIFGRWGVKFKVYEKGGYLTINGTRLDEYEPGVFFTEDADCLDFSGPMPLWKGTRAKKIR